MPTFQIEKEGEVISEFTSMNNITNFTIRRMGKEVEMYILKHDWERLER